MKRSEGANGYTDIIVKGPIGPWPEMYIVEVKQHLGRNWKSEVRTSESFFIATAEAGFNACNLPSPEEVEEKGPQECSLTAITHEEGLERIAKLRRQAEDKLRKMRPADLLAAISGL